MSDYKYTKEGVVAVVGDIFYKDKKLLKSIITTTELDPFTIQKVLGVLYSESYYKEHIGQEDPMPIRLVEENCNLIKIILASRAEEDMQEILKGDILFKQLSKIFNDNEVDMQKIKILCCALLSDSITTPLGNWSRTPYLTGIQW